MQLAKRSILPHRPTKRAPDAVPVGRAARFASSSFLRLFIFLAGRLRRPRPSAGTQTVRR